MRSLRAGSQPLTGSVDRIVPASHEPNSRVVSPPLNGSNLGALRASPGRMIPAIHPADQNCSAVPSPLTGRLESSHKSSIAEINRTFFADRRSYFTNWGKSIGGKKCKPSDCCASVSTRASPHKPRTVALAAPRYPTAPRLRNPLAPPRAPTLGSPVAEPGPKPQAGWVGARCLRVQRSSASSEGSSS